MNRIFSKSVLVFLSILAIPLQSVTSRTLSGGVEHSQTLPSVYDSLKEHKNGYMYNSQNLMSAGVSNIKPLDSSFSPNNTHTFLLSRGKIPEQGMPSYGGNVRRTFPNAPGLNYSRFKAKWFMIPAWMAGVWMKNGDLTLEETNLRTGRRVLGSTWTDNCMTVTWGHQADSRGNIWHVNIVPFERDGHSAGKLVRFFCTEQNSYMTSPQELRSVDRYVVSETNCFTSCAVETFQQESINNYRLGKEGELVNHSSNRIFTYRGLAVREGYLVSRFNRQAGFSPKAFINGINLKESLANFLSSRDSKKVLYYE